MKTYSFREEPFRLDGVPFFYETGVLRRYSDEILQKEPRLKEFDRKLTNARLRFKIKGKKLKVTIKTENFYHDIGMAFYQVNCGYLYLGEYSRGKYAALLSSPDWKGSTEVSAEVDLPDGVTPVTVFMPRNPNTVDIIIQTDDEAQILPPDGYSFGKPFVFYGSSITECGITAPPNSYAALLSRWFDADFYNFGASGNARGEICVAEHIAKLDMSVFFMDYDHNAPTAQWLKETHLPFFMRFRELRPDVPVIMTSRPSDDGDDFILRRDIVKASYDYAVQNGDKNVYFVDGSSFFEGYDRERCTIDRTHPNDLGHYLMARRLAKEITKITGKNPAEY